MGDQMWNQLKTLMGFETGSKVGLIFETLSDQAPIIGKVLTTYKIYRLGERLKENEDKIDIISNKVNQIEDEKLLDLLKNFLFPVVLQKLLDEDEDNKTGYFLDGFGQVVDNQLADKSKLLLYYDVLKELRFIEIEYLISFSSDYRKHRADIYYKTGGFPEYPFNSSEFLNIKFAIENKLERIGLINTGRLITYKQIMDRLNKNIKSASRHLAGSSDLEDDVKLTKFGYDFLNFFYLIDKYKFYEDELNY